MKQLIALTAFILAAVPVLSQAPYFQQQVDYTITVTLKDTTKTLHAKERVLYRNNSPDQLGEIWFHLWPNAYKNNGTALAKQLLSSGNTRLYYSKESDRGYIDSLAFTIDGQAVKWEYDKEHIDICRLVLNKPLAPGQTALIETPFFVKIPSARFSRLGHMDQSLAITQWYPKPAVYDNRGWHPMPYLNQGEFYSEFGSFDVSITLPDNYVLAATGDRVDAADEERFLEMKMNETREFLVKLKSDSAAKKKHDPVNKDIVRASQTVKTVRFRQDKVHDFAWFADRRYLVIKDKVTLPESGRNVDTWVFFTPGNADQWQYAAGYVGQAVLHYSKYVGEYPYKHATAVDGTIMAGGGMEYPNITVIGNVGSAIELDMVITHEVGHNWFYGILGSNERRYPFLDEGFNSFYEMLYVRERYPNEKITKYIDKDTTFKLLRINKVPYWKFHEIIYYFSLRQRVDQPLNLHSTDYSGLNYGAIVYSKTPLVLDYMRDWMGDAAFDKAMHAYFDAWKFRHPYPEDFFGAMTHSSGKNFDAVNTHLFQTTDRIDYKFSHAKKDGTGGYRLKVRNVSGSNLPFNVYGYDKDGKVTGVQWYEGFRGAKNLTFSAPNTYSFSIDGLQRMPDINRKNNNIRSKGLFKKCDPLQISFISAYEDPSRTQLNYLPLVGGNYYNGLLTGVVFHNYGVFRKRFEYSLAPMWGWKSSTLTGYADAAYSMFPNALFREITIGASVKSFGYDYYRSTQPFTYGDLKHQVLMNYLKVAPYVTLDLMKRATSAYRQTVSYRYNSLNTDSADSRALVKDMWPSIKTARSYVNELTYRVFKKSSLRPWDFALNLQQNDRMAKVSGTFNYEFNINSKRRMYVRVFAGTFVSGDQSARSYYAYRASGYSGYQDYLFDHNFIARNERHGVGFSQFAETDGAMKAWTTYGQSTSWLASVNLKSPKIPFMPFRIYADAVFTERKFMFADDFLWSAGLNISVLRNVVDIYYPAVSSRDVTDGAAYLAWYEKFRFTLNLHLLKPREFLKSAIN